MYFIKKKIMGLDVYTKESMADNEDLLVLWSVIKSYNQYIQ